MFFTKKQLQANSRTRAHWSDLWAQRGIYSLAQNSLQLEADKLGAHIAAVNAAGAFGNEFWKEIDAQVVEIRDETTGMEILEDLMAVQTVLPIGKTAQLYTKVSDIAEDVQVTLDGQAPYTFDDVSYASGGDPIPVFTAGFGVNWRKAEGLSTVNIDVVLDAQAAKLKHYNRRLVKYLLSGDDNIVVEGYKAAGLKNHASTSKVNINGGINLTSADQSALNTFFVTGSFGQNRVANFVDAYDVAWVSPEVWVNINKPYMVNGQNTGQSIQQALKETWGIKEFRQTFALSGNEMLAYQRRKSVVSPLVGMTTGVVALPRPLPNSNFNFQIMGAMGIQVKSDTAGKSGVVYVADLGV